MVGHFWQRWLRRATFIYPSLRSTTQDGEKKDDSYLEDGPVHRHSGAVIVGPPLQVFRRVGVLNSVTIFLVDLRQLYIGRYVKATVDCKKHFLEEEKALLLELLALFEYVRHVLLVLCIILVNLAKSLVVFFFCLQGIVFAFYDAVLKLFHLQKRKIWEKNCAERERKKEKGER